MLAIGEILKALKDLIERNFSRNVKIVEMTSEKIFFQVVNPDEKDRGKKLLKMIRTLVDRYLAEEVEVSDHSREKLVLSLKKNIERA
ncbi:MAG: hypothetical protein QXF37_02800 [Archaeoglobaceae archaeon]